MHHVGTEKKYFKTEKNISNRNMVRNVTFWYTKELSIFENNEDLPSTKVDVTRMPAGETERPC